MTRSFMIDQLGQEYILAARAKGLSSLRIIWSEALGNIMVPLITVVALSYGNLLEGAVLTETVFAWPGLGMYMKNALFNADMNAVLGGTLVIGVCTFASICSRTSATRCSIQERASRGIRDTYVCSKPGRRRLFDTAVRVAGVASGSQPEPVGRLASVITIGAS